MKQWIVGELPNGIIQDDFKNLDYINEPFNDSTMMKEWDEIYGPIYGTGELVDYRHYQPEWANNIAKYLGLNLAGISFYRMGPGKILPYHADAYVRYVEHYQIEDVNSIFRAVVFLEDWKPGHIFEVDGHPLVTYKAGTFAMWQYDTPHMAANLGPEDRYTLQITGIK